MKYSVGARVRVRGLVTAAEHNGKNGGVVGVQGERYKVKIEGATSILAVKKVNLFGDYLVRVLRAKGLLRLLDATA